MGWVFSQSWINIWRFCYEVKGSCWSEGGPMQTKHNHWLRNLQLFMSFVSKVGAHKTRECNFMWWVWCLYVCVMPFFLNIRLIIIIISYVNNMFLAMCVMATYDFATKNWKKNMQWTYNTMCLQSHYLKNLKVTMWFFKVIRIWCWI